jgi:hypothetical protein
MKLHPLTTIIIGLLLCSIGFNITFFESNKKLVYKIQKLEAGPARGLFIRPDEEQPKAPLSDEEINDLLKEMLKKMIRERIV